MSAHVRSSAGISFSGSVMRYAEIERAGSVTRLLRLGNCDFEFDAASELFSPSRPTRLEVIREALSDVFSGTTADVVRAVVPGDQLVMFQTRVGRDAGPAERNRQIALETRVLAGEDADGDLFPAGGAGDDHESSVPVHVAHAGTHMAERVMQVGAVFGDVTFQMIPRSTAVHQAMYAVQARTGWETSLVVGAFDGSTEYQFMVDGDRKGDVVHAVTHPMDRLYFALEALSAWNINPADVARVVLHGDRVDGPLIDAMNDVWGTRAVLANPGPAVRLEEGRLEASFGFEAFLATVGAAIL
ncbi:MAG: hypothetical protein RIE53_04385 [Rhodothermales bacterium]